MGKPRRADAALIAAAACALAAASPCAASPARLSASLGFAGTVVPGRWNPLWARCDGEVGEASIEVVLRSEDGVEIGIESFPGKDGLRLECPVMVDERLQSVSVRLVSSGEILAEEKLAARSKLFPGHVVLVCGEGFDAELAISAALYPSEPVQAVSLGLSDLPSRGLDYDGISAVALRDPGMAIAPAQRDAMASWIAGGGRLAVTAPRAIGDSVIDGLFRGGAAPRGAAERWADAGGYPPVMALGLGTVVLVGEAAAGGAQGEAERRWKAALALRPYGSAERLTASRAFKSAGAAFSKGPEAARGEIVVLVALALWAGVAILASRNRRKSLAPVAAAAAASLAFALAGAVPLDSMLRRGARVSSRALVLPGEGSAIVSVGVRTSFGDSRREFLSVKALRGLEVGYGTLEGGRMGASEGSAFEWSHELPRSALSFRSSSRDALDLVGVLESEELEKSGFPARASSAALSSGLPELESVGRVAVALAGPRAAPWLVRKDGKWIEEAYPPVWIGLDLAWIEALRALAPGRSFIVGRSLEPALRLSVGGSAASELLWAMPLPAGSGPAGAAEARS